jgi:hypothetical protein
MPSSLVIGALVVAWLVVLVPMVSRRRQEIAYTADAALAARVVRSGVACDGLVSGAGSGARREAHTMPNRSDEDWADSVDVIDGPPDEAASEQETTELPLPAEEDLRRAPSAGQPASEPMPPRPYRPGRGGYDEHSAELQARVKYATRRRVVGGIVVTALVLALLAAVGPAGLWWLQVLADLSLVGYLGYLRRQVRIEEDVRRRRAARLGAMAEEEDAGDAPPARPLVAPGPPPAVHPGARLVDPDDDDPAFDELDDSVIPPYRPAVGE